MPRRHDAVPLSEERLLEAALKIVDEAGIQALSMRKLGASLGVDAMAVYYYFPSKQALLQRLVETVFGSLRSVAAEGIWQSRVFDWANAYRELALAHRNLVFQIFSNREAVNIAVAIANESLHAAVAASNLQLEHIERAADTLVDFVHGFVLGEAAAGQSTGSMDGVFRFSIELITRGIEATVDGS